MKSWFLFSLVATISCAVPRADALTIVASDTWAENGHTYQVVELRDSNWDQARSDALTNFPGYDLATITSQQETDFIVSLLNGLGWDWWIGAFQTTSKPETDPAAGWEWVTGETWSYTNWGFGEPNNAGGFEDHATVERGGLNWNDCCTAPGARGYIVETLPSPIPVPASLPLLGCAIGGLVLLRRRTRTKLR